MYERIKVDIKVCHGKPVIRGTRIMVWQILDLLEDGLTFDEIIANYFPQITKEDIKTGVRFPDFRRAERLPWCAPIIRNSRDPVVKTWDLKERRGKIRTYLWLGKMDYVVVLEKRKNKKKVFLVTAYYVEGESTKRRLTQKYNSRLQ